MLDISHYLDLADGRFNQTNSQNLAALFESLEAANTKDHLVVYFHGGLVSRAAGEESAEHLLPFCKGTYPVFFLWRSDLWSTLTCNLVEIANEPIFRRLVKRLVQLALGTLAHHVGARGAGLLQLESEEDLPDDLIGLAEFAAVRGPQGSLRGVSLTDMQRDQAETELETDEVIKRESQAIAAGVVSPHAAKDVRARAAAAGITPRPTLMSAAIVDEIAQEEKKAGARVGVAAILAVAKHAAEALVRVIRRFSGGHDHGLYTTAVEEVLRELYLDSVGGTIWAMMKKETSNAFRDDPHIFAGTAFLQHLKKWWRPGRRMTLIGHSTGAIYIGNFLEAADNVLDEAARFDVLFLAPACSFEFMATKLPVFTKRVSNIRSFGRRLFATVESDNTLRVVDTATNNMIATIKLTGRPNQCAVTPDGHYVAVPIRDKGAVDIVDVIAPVPASDFPVPANVAKAWCDTQHDGDSAFNQILAPFTEIPVKRSLTESFLDDFAKAARVALEKTLTMRAVSFVEQAKTLHLPTFAGGRQLRSATSP